MFGRHHERSHGGPWGERGWERGCAPGGRWGRGGGFDDDGPAGYGPRGGWFGGRGGGRVFAHGDLKLVLLALIGEKPSHGYELIRAIEDKFGGAYAPSPGAVYPTLTLLEEQDFIRGETAGSAKKLYTVTPAGEAFLKENAVAVQAVLSRMDLAASAFASHSTPESVREAFRTLRQSLHMRRGPWTAAEAERVRMLIEKAARDIVGGGDA